MINRHSVAILGAALLLTSPALAVDPYAKPDDSWISISGTVTSTAPDSFRLDYGSGMITVEMDDWDMDSEGYLLMNGDNVTVYGYVDDDLYEARTIEAGSVYVEGLNTYFYANSADEEDVPFAYWSTTSPIVAGQVELTGTVTSVNGRKFTIDTGPARVTVDTSDLVYNPMDDEGFQKVEQGDRVRVSGTLEDTFFDNLQLSAELLVTLNDSNRSR